MVERVVMDASVLVAGFLEHDRNHAKAIAYLQDLDAGDYQLHLPWLALLETCAAINRETRSDNYALAIGAKTSMEDWAREGKVVFYPLDNAETERSVSVALRDGFKGTDSTYASLAEQRNITLKSFDNDHLTRFRGKVSR